MFGKILIANRGEIACRIIRTARRMGIATVAVYSDADRDALHVEMADEAVAIGPPPASASYLVIDAMVAACRATGADAVHPGYGFLSERAAFAEALAAAGIAFIGPNPGAIAAMGDKIESKKRAAAAGVPVVPGSRDPVDDLDQAIAVAADLGLPLMIKASAGGGGKGMRVIRRIGEIAEAMRAARSEARSAFGDDRVLIERYIENPRHIEIQVLGDKHGNTVHLGERECSIQRRHQKVIEEAPSPAVDEDLRRVMGDHAVALAQAVGYDSAGTVEFIMDAGRRFYFLEMNTRLQVEHPVSECVTGIALVEQMIRVAAGERLGFTQDDIRIDGWAIEARLYAEDPARGFLPAIGRLDRYRPPAEGASGETLVRIDTGVAEGSEISIHYDPLIAKLITHGPDRAAAVDAMAAALDRFVVDGIANNHAFLAAIMANRRWRAGDLSTAFIAEEFPDGFATVDPDPETRACLAAVALAVVLRRRRRLTGLPDRLNGEGRRWRADWVATIGDARLRLTARQEAGGGLAIAVADGKPRAVVTDWRPGEPIWSGTVGGQAMTIQVRPLSEDLQLLWRGVVVTARIMAPHVAALAALMPVKRAAAAVKEFRCPMPGLVVAIDVAVGQAVRAGEPLVVVEAMKMQNVLRAERDATVARIAVQTGDSLQVDDVIIEFE